MSPRALREPRTQHLFLLVKFWINHTFSGGVMEHIEKLYFALILAKNFSQF